MIGRTNANSNLSYKSGSYSANGATKTINVNFTIKQLCILAVGSANMPQIYIYNADYSTIKACSGGTASYITEHNKSTGLVTGFNDKSFTVYGFPIGTTVYWFAIG